MNDKEVKAFYNSSAWKHKRMEILERDRYECQDCRKKLKKAAEHGERLSGRDPQRFEKRKKKLTEEKW